MRARIVGAAHAEQRALAELRFHEHVETSLRSLVSAIQKVPQVWAANPNIFDDCEKSDDLAYWTKPELPCVVSSLCELELLVKDRVAIVDMRDTDYSIDASPEMPKTQARSSALFASLISHLVLGLIDPVAHTYEVNAKTTSETFSAKDTCVSVRVRFPTNEGEALFPSHYTILLPVCIYVGWRCCFRLLDAFRRLLHVDEDDGFAGWMDVASAMLDSLHRATQSLSSIHPVMTGSIDDPAQALDIVHDGANTWTGIAHSYWWWWSFTYAFRSAHGDIDSVMKDDLTQLWCIGRSSAIGFLRTVVLPSAACALQLSMSSLVFLEVYSNSSNNNSTTAVRACVRDFTAAIEEVQRLADDLFPDVEKVQLVVTGAAAPESRRVCTASPPDPLQNALRSSSAAASSFVRLVVHDALRPLAQRVLDDPASLQARRPSLALSGNVVTSLPPFVATNAAGAAAAVLTTVTAGAAQDGWGDSDDDGEWEEVRVLCSANASLSRSTSGHLVDAEKGASASVTPSAASPPPASAMVAPPSPPSPPPVTIMCSRDALTFVLDTLEAQYGREVVRQDSIAMTLRRLLL
jgi:hypothetical protein